MSKRAEPAQPSTQLPSFDDARFAPGALRCSCPVCSREHVALHPSVRPLPSPIHFGDHDYRLRNCRCVRCVTGSPPIVGSARDPGRCPPIGPPNVLEKEGSPNLIRYMWESAGFGEEQKAAYPEMWDAEQRSRTGWQKLRDLLGALSG